MPDDPVKHSKRVLEPFDRLSEILFGLIMVLTFTGSLNVAEEGRESVRTMLVGALGCNLAWGIIDGVFYLMGCLAEKSRGLSTLHAVRAADRDTAHRIIAGALPSAVSSILQPDDFERMRERLKGLPEPPARARLRADDWTGAAAVFGLVFLSTFPVTIPFIFMQEVTRALRVSNGIAIAMLFLIGYAYGRFAGRRPFPTGIAMVVLGFILVGMTIALGG